LINPSAVILVSSSLSEMKKPRKKGKNTVTKKEG